MEHVTINQHGRQLSLTADSGYLLRSKVTGKKYKSVETLGLERWEVIADGTQPPKEQPKAKRGGKGKPKTE